MSTSIHDFAFCLCPFDLIASSAASAPFRRRRNDSFRSQIDRGRAVHLVVVDEDSVQSGRARHFIVSRADELHRVIVRRRRKGIVAEGERVGQRLGDIRLRLQLFLDLLENPVPNKR